MALLSRFATNARRRSGRQRAIAVAAIAGPNPINLDQAVIEEIAGSGWRVRVNSLTFGWGFPDRQTAEAYLVDLERQRSKDDANGQ